MSASSRVPLLPKGKGRKPSRLTIAPRAKPSTVDRSKRVATPPASEASVDDHTTSAPKDAASVSSARTEKRASAIPSKRAETLTGTGNSSAPPVIPVAITHESPVAGAAVSTVASPSFVAKRAGGISIGGSLSASTAAATTRKPTVAPMTRSPVILPVQRHPNGNGLRVERLAKMSGAGSLYRTHASPVLGPRAMVSPGHAPLTAKDGSNPLVKRIVHKLDIRPHQSPRRAAVQLQARHPRTESISSVTNSPLLLASRAPPGMDKGDGDVDVLGERAVVKRTNKQDDSTPNGKQRQSKRRKTVDESVKPPTKTSAEPRRESLQRKAKTNTRYRRDMDSEEESDDDQDEDVNPDELELPEDSTKIYVPARERATMWAKSLLLDSKLGDEEDGNYDADNSRALVTTEKTSANPRARRKRSTSNASSIASLIALSRGPSRKKSELMKKEPSQMTMGELALTIPKGRRMNQHEREESADASVPAGDTKSSSLLNMNALKRVHSLSVSSESTALGGSLVTPQVQIVDGKMVILESTIKLDEHLHQQLRAEEDDLHNDSENGIPPRYFGPRLNSSHPNGPGRRWSKEETKQFYYCLSQVGANFSMMATLFPKRKRKELKSKFKFEEKNHPRLIEIALRASAAPLDSEMVDAIAKMIDKETQRKIEKKKKRRRESSSFMDQDGESEKDDAERHAEPDTLSSRLPSTGRAYEAGSVEEEVEEVVEDDDEYTRERHDSFDFAG